MKTLLRSALASLSFYTCLPVPGAWDLDFRRIARFAPGVGLLLGSTVGAIVLGLERLGMGDLLAAGVGVALSLGITGGLHLDGAMDTADGLAVLDPQRRLAVMADSVTGAFGAMAGVIILLLKTLALGQLLADRPEALPWIWGLVAGWGRWGQVEAIARYPYLKAQGKGAFHKTDFCWPWDWLLGLGGLGLGAGLGLGLGVLSPGLAIGITGDGAALALGIAAWFKGRLGGHTGDTYGAVVEWTETLLLCVLTLYV